MARTRWRSANVTWTVRVTLVLPRNNPLNPIPSSPLASHSQRPGHVEVLSHYQQEWRLHVDTDVRDAHLQHAEHLGRLEGRICQQWRDCTC